MMSPFSTRALFGFCLSALVFAGPADATVMPAPKPALAAPSPNVTTANPAPALSLTPADSADLHRIEVYLNGIKSLEARFEQYNPDGSISDGQLWLSRPGKMRFEYHPPVQMVIVSDGNYVAVDDRELHNVSFYPVDSTPAWFLLRAAITLSGDVTLTHFERGPKTFRLTAVQTRDPSAGSISLVFTDAPLALKQWSILDSAGRTTTLALFDAKEAQGFAADLFRLPSNPSQGNDAR